MTNFYTEIKELTEKHPNNMELGAAIRKLINKIEDSKKIEVTNPNQITIFDAIENKK